MPLISHIRGVPVAGPKGRHLGEVTEVLFHPSEPRVIGFQVQPPPWLWLIALKPRYLPLGRVCAWSDEVLVSSTGLPGGREGERETGASWDRTVIWRRMPVLSEGGAEAGHVADAGFRKLSGTVTRAFLSGGTVSAAAYGVREVPAELIVGFEADASGGGAVRVRDAALDMPASGGVVRAAGEAAGATRDAASGMAREAGIKAAAAGMAAAKMVSASNAGKVTGRVARRAWKGVRSVLAEALRPEDEE